ncbi:MAG: hypothetical protein CMG75_02265 [Candidatus Marinimicrobia bacterium]|nr:hypothetical protein [Candidatus Neomarinimicrobiota bacterium]|tara:strand:- start:10243 stop:12384 length:2142 start_codon:yes stop_codon:yes gene_type:complete
MMISFSLLFGGKRLTLKDVSETSPFSIASIGKVVWIPNKDIYSFLKSKNGIKSIYQVNLVKGDTTLFLDGKNLIFQNKLLNINSYNFSPDGKRLLIQTNRKKIWRRSNFGTYWIYHLEKNTLEPVSLDNDRLRNVKFSPDGQMVAYVREDNNLYTFQIERQRERQLTRTGSDVILNGHFGWVYEEEFMTFDAYLWSPDSRRIAYFEENQSRVPVFTILNNLELYPETKKIRYPKAGKVNPTIRIGIVRANGGSTKWMDIGKNNNVYFPRMYWKNLEQLLIIRMRRLQNHWDLLICNPKTGQKRQGISETDENGWVEIHDNYKFLGSNEILWVSERSGYNHLYLHTIKGQEITRLTYGKWEVNDIIRVDQQEKEVYFTANRESVLENHLYKVSFNGKDLELLTSEQGLHSIQFSPSGKFFIDSFSSVSEPNRILLKRNDGNLVRVIGETDIDQFDDYDWSTPIFTKFSTHDRTEMLDGLITLPINYIKGNKYPLIVYNYGMPGSQIVKNQWGSIWNQFLAQEGFIVFSLDSRGMGGRGESFQNLSFGDLSKYLSRDHIAGLEHMISEWNVDKKRVGAWGWSGGGYFTCLMLTKNSRHFKAGVSIAPVTDFRLYDTIYTERFMGLPENNIAGYDSTSVFSYVENTKGELLVIHGTADDNVHSQNTFQLAEKFIEAGKSLEVFFYPNRNHGIHGVNSRLHLYTKMYDHFRKHLLEK